MKTYLNTITKLFLTFFVFTSQAQEHMMMDAVPMQGGMIMIALRYDEAEKRIHANVPDVTPMLMPLSASHPNHHFHATSPWYQALDPSQHGMAFNRQYGIAMAGNSDFLPIGAGIWIREVSGDDALKSFNYRNTDADNQAWDPIFGDSDSSQVWEWNLRMFHPAYAAPKGSGPLMATYEVYMVHGDTGHAMEDVHSATFTLHWESMPMEGDPTLNIANKVVLSWQGAYSGYVVESADTLDDPTWSQMPMTPVLYHGEYIVIVDASGPQKYYRLTRGQMHDGHEGHEGHASHP